MFASGITDSWGPVLSNWHPYLSGLRLTVIISVISFFVALAIGIIGASARRSPYKLIRFIAAVYVEVFRNTPLLLQIFVAYFGLPEMGLPLSGFQAGVVALALHSGAYQTEILRGGLASIPLGQYDATKVLSLSPFDTFTRIVLPQAIRNVFPPIINEFIQILLGSSLLSAIAVSELTGVAETVNSETLLTLQTFAVALVLYLVASNVISAAANIFAAKAFHPPLDRPARSNRKKLRKITTKDQQTGGATA